MSLDPQQAYDSWSSQYDTNDNRTRDREALVLRTTLADRHFARVLEIGCGTGKNTTWLVDHAEQITAVDLSEGMLGVARSKVTSPKAQFIQADILQPWSFANGLYDLVTFSLVLEHIEDLRPMFIAAAEVLRPGGIIYVGELHPFKQYSGTKARFQTEEGLQVVRCTDHHISDFLDAARYAGLELQLLQEHFDEDDRTLPRILSLLFRRPLH